MEQIAVWLKEKTLNPDRKSILKGGSQVKSLLFNPFLKVEQSEY